MSSSRPGLAMPRPATVGGSDHNSDPKDNLGTSVPGSLSAARRATSPSILWASVSASGKKDARGRKE